MNKFKKIFFVTAIFMAVGVAGSAKAALVGDTTTFNINPNYDTAGRSSTQATLVATTSSFYFYVQTDFWMNQGQDKKTEMLADFNSVSDEFANTIYPTLTSLFGLEARPGIDNDPKITLLFESANNNLGGYFRSNDEYSKLQVSDSNEREMLYLPVSQIASPQLKMFLAHEFVHLITFNQKENSNGVQEEVWLNEARADYASTLLGYDDGYEGSNLQRRVQDFLTSPSTSLTEWENTKYNYAATNLFIHYLVDHYGVRILADSLKSKLIGIPSINQALLKNGFKEDFAQIFTNWTVAMVINDCSVDQAYCYLNKNLANLKINPNLIFLPLTGDSSLSTNNTMKNWMGSWQKIIGGGNGNLRLQFSSQPGLNFQLPYIVYDKANHYTVHFLHSDAGGKVQIDIKDFGSNYNSLVVIPSFQTKISGFGGPITTYPYTFTISIAQNAMSGDQTLIQQLQDQIEALKKRIAALQAGTAGASCALLQRNLFVGISGNDVICLQQFLKAQGDQIYPEGMVTGFFGSFTKAAVIRFQAKYGILQTGYVGILTRTKINTLLTP